MQKTLAALRRLRYTRSRAKDLAEGASVCVNGSRGLGRNQVICLHLARRGGASERQTGGPDVGENSEWVMTRGVGSWGRRACVRNASGQ